MIGDAEFLVELEPSVHAVLKLMTVVAGGLMSVIIVNVSLFFFRLLVTLPMRLCFGL